jgi:hypothetical protein
MTQASFVVSDVMGRIVMTGEVPQAMLADQPLVAGQTIVAGVGHWDTDYVSNGAILPRPANPSTISGMTISNVPNPSTVTIDGVNPQTVTDGTADLSFTQPGTYTVVVSSWPMRDATFTVTQP